jgi:hypothetical protein
MLSDEVRGIRLPPLGFIDLREPHSPNRVCALTAGGSVHHSRAGPHITETAGRARMRDHYGAEVEEPRRPVTSAPTSPTTHAAASSEKARPRRTTVATTVGIETAWSLTK